MNLIGKTILVAAGLTAGIAFAQDKEATDPTVIAWKQLMRQNGAAAKTLGDMAGGKAPFEAAAAEAAKAKLIEDAKNIPVVFQTQASDPASKVKPEIWTNWDDFVAKAGALASAAQALDASTEEGVKAGMGTVGGTCMACHQAYRL